jgi:hypothetical protein
MDGLCLQYGIGEATPSKHCVHGEAQTAFYIALQNVDNWSAAAFPGLSSSLASPESEFPVWQVPPRSSSSMGISSPGMDAFLAGRAFSSQIVRVQLGARVKRGAGPGAGLGGQPSIAVEIAATNSRGRGTLAGVEGAGDLFFVDHDDHVHTGL